MKIQLKCVNIIMKIQLKCVDIIMKIQLKLTLNCKFPCKFGTLSRISQEQKFGKAKLKNGYVPFSNPN